MNGEESSACTILMRKSEGKRSLGNTRQKWVDNIKMRLREIGWDGMNWIDLTQDRDKWCSCEHCDESSGSIKCWEVFD
jgi:hypothetical protein